VKMIRRRWWPFQPRGIVMAPTGNIHFHPDSPLWSEDFSRERLSLQALFIHEMTHVWQAQTRGRFYLVLMRHPFCRYAYELEPGKQFGSYGLEQQAGHESDSNSVGGFRNSPTFRHYVGHRTHISRTGVHYAHLGCLADHHFSVRVRSASTRANRG